jgi:lipopolysaccharide transport system permease protein
MDKITIEAGRSEKNYWGDLWRFKELFYILSWRDFKVRYKQTALGIAWAVLRPFLTMMVFTFVFGRIAKLPPEGSAPYAVMVFAAMLPWQFFSNALTEASNSLVGNSNLISKVYFPRLIVPASAIITSFVDFGISFLLFIGIMVYYQYMPSINIIALPLFLIMTFLFAFGLGVYLTALNVKYRDFKYIIPFVVQFGIYISPVGFSSTIVPERYRLLYSLNPMVGIIDGFRWCIIGTPVDPYAIFISIAISVVFLFIGIRYFRKTEKTFADII